jgi:hypothetical protein
MTLPKWETFFTRGISLDKNVATRPQQQFPPQVSQQTQLLKCATQADKSSQIFEV